MQDILRAYDQARQGVYTQPQLDTLMSSLATIPATDQQYTEAQLNFDLNIDEVLDFGTISQVQIKAFRETYNLIFDAIEGYNT